MPTFLLLNIQTFYRELSVSLNLLTFVLGKMIYLFSKWLSCSSWRMLKYLVSLKAAFVYNFVLPWNYNMLYLNTFLNIIFFFKKVINFWSAEISVFQPVMRAPLVDHQITKREAEKNWFLKTNSTSSFIRKWCIRELILRALIKYSTQSTTSIYLAGICTLFSMQTGDFKMNWCSRY